MRSSGRDSTSLSRRNTDIRSHDCALKELDHHSDRSVAIDIYRKRCGTNIILLRIEDAIEDLAYAIHLFLHSPSTREEFYPATEKSAIVNWLNKRELDDIHDDNVEKRWSKRLSKGLMQLAMRIKWDLGMRQPTASYDLKQMAGSISPMSLHIDAPNYIADTEIRFTESHGRGLFAKRDFEAGELVVVEKAYVMPGYFIQDKSSECNLYCVENGVASQRAGALLFKELVQKLRWNRTLRKEFFELEDGGYWEKNGWKLGEGEEIPVDV